MNLMQNKQMANQIERFENENNRLENHVIINNCIDFGLIHGVKKFDSMATPRPLADYIHAGIEVESRILEVIPAILVHYRCFVSDDVIVNEDLHLMMNLLQSGLKNDPSKFPILFGWVAPEKYLRWVNRNPRFKVV